MHEVIQPDEPEFGKIGEMVKPEPPDQEVFSEFAAHIQTEVDRQFVGIFSLYSGDVAKLHATSLYGMHREELSLSMETILRLFVRKGSYTQAADWITAFVKTAQDAQEAIRGIAIVYEGLLHTGDFKGAENMLHFLHVGQTPYFGTYLTNFLSSKAPAGLKRHVETRYVEEISAHKKTVDAFDRESAYRNGYRTRLQKVLEWRPSMPSVPQFLRRKKKAPL